MKKFVLCILSGFIAATCGAGISIVDSATDGYSSIGSVTGVFSSVTAQVGDMIVVVAATNKRGDDAQNTLQQTGGTGTTATQTLLTNGMGTYPTSWGWYMPVLAGGTFSYELHSSGITAVGAVYVLRSDSGQVELADTSSWDDTDNADNGTSYALNYSFSTNLTDGVLIEAIGARTDLISEPAFYAEDIQGGNKRVIVSYENVTGASWSSVYSVSNGTAAKQTSGALGLVFAEGAGGVAADVMLEEWLFEDVPGGQELQYLTNSAGTAQWISATASVTNNGLGQLVITQGGSYYRNTDGLSDGAKTTGTYEMEFLMNTIDLSAGDSSGASVGFGFRDNSVGKDLFLIRLLKQSNKLLLGTRIDNSNQTLHDFGVTSLNNLLVRSEIDLDAGTAEVFYSLNGGGETAAGTVNLSTNAVTWDRMRFVAVTGSEDWGTTDRAEIEYLTVIEPGGGPVTEFTDVDLNSPQLYVQGAQFANVDGNGLNFHRFDTGILSGSNAANLNPTRARTTSGVKLTFYTRSDTVKLHFDYVPGDENRNSRFGLYQNGVQTDTPYFSKTETNVVLTLTSLGAPGEIVRHDVVLPNWSNPILSRMELKSGQLLEVGNPYPAKQMVVLGDSISHGTGQGASYETYPYIAAQLMDMEILNMAVGGAKIAPEVADLLDDFDPVEAIWCLVGYNNWQGSSHDITTISNSYESLLTTVRLHQPNAELFCCTLTYTTNIVDAESGVTAEEVRDVVSDIVNARIAGGDDKLHLVQGDDHSDGSYLNDPVHFNVSGAARFATNMVSIVEPVVSPPVSPYQGTNVLFIAIDDMKPLLGCYGDTNAITPQIDRLASSGVTFLNAQCQWAVCGPSRASLMTGLYPEETGVQGFKKMRGDADDGSKVNGVKRPNVVTLPQHFRYNSYTTAATGKLNDFRCVGTLNTGTGKVAEDGAVVDDPPSWGDPVNPSSLPSDFFSNSAYVQAASGWDPAGKPAVAVTNLPDSAFTDGIACDEGISLLQSLATGDNQFFLGVGFKKPHLGFYAPQQYWDQYTNTNFEIHPFQDHPANAVSYTWNYAKELESYDDFNPSIPGYISATNIPPAKQLELIHGYYACVSFIDAQVGRLLDELETLNLHTNTIVVLWGDHGFHLGDHGEWAKHTNLEQAARVPLIIHNPFSTSTNVTTEAPANFTDIYPTVCELAGLSVPEQPLAQNEAPTAPASGRAIKGRSLVPVMEDPASSVQQGALTLFSRSGALGYAYRTERYRYIEWINKASDTIVARELYDYETDPYETVNLAGNTAHFATVYDLSSSMRAELDALKLSETDLACPELQSLELPPPTPQTGQTNIVLVVIDDLGWMDLSVQGSEFYETPRIDELANNGMRFTQGYAAHPRCLPSRYGLMTGRFPGANGVPGGQPENCLRPWETTIAEALRDGGYATCFSGKWHLIGTHGADNLPQNQGFDVNFSGGKAGAPPTYFYPYRQEGTAAPTDELDKNALYFEEEGVEGEYVTDRLTDEAIEWMTWNAHKPMFLSIWHYGVHTPYEAPQALVDKYTAKLATMDYGDLPEEINVGIGQQKMRQDHPTYAAMIESVDTNVGRLMDQLDAMGISSNTVIIFTSDNGGLSNRGGYNTRELATSNWPLRTGKGWLYEGGVREAFIVSGAGVVPMVNSNAVVTGTDVFPTCLELAGLPLQPTNHHDGVSFLSALGGSAYDRGEPIFWHSPQARPYSTGDFNSSAVRDGEFKLIWFYDTPGKNYELYNVVADPGETTDLSVSNPSKAAELLGKIQAWHAGAHDGAGVVFRPDGNDVAKPPQDYQDDPSVPLSLVPTSGNADLWWNDYEGFDYELYSRTNLLSGNWVSEGSGALTNAILPMVGNGGFYKVELMLQPEA